MHVPTSRRLDSRQLRRPVDLSQTAWKGHSTMRAKLRRPHLLFVTAIVCLVGASEFTEVAYSARWCRSRRRARCCRPATYEIGPCGCPLYPIPYTCERGYCFFYCDFFENCDDDFPDGPTTLMLPQTTPYPYTRCGEYPCWCEGARKKNACPHAPAYVSENYMQSVKGVTVEDPNHYVSMQLQGETSPRWGKLLTFKISGRTRYMAFEMDHEPDAQPGRTKSQISDKVKKKRSEYFYYGVEDRNQHKVLFWLHKPG